MSRVYSFSAGSRSAPARPDAPRAYARNSGRWVLIEVVSLVVLGAAPAGCTASGVPRFVKFSRDGRWLIYEDQTYPRVYVRDLHSGKAHKINGSAAAIGPDADQLVLTPRRLNWPCARAGRAELLLVEFGSDPPRKTRLPALNTEPSYPQLHVAFVGQRSLRAAGYAPGYLTDLSQPARRYRLSDWWSTWEPDTNEPVQAGDSPSVWQCLPDGVERGGFAFAPHSLERHGFTWGPGAEEEWHGDHVVRLLRSPDSRYVVCVYPDSDPWRRLTLTDASTGKREVILDKDDAAWDTFVAVTSWLTLPLRWLLLPA